MKEPIQQLADAIKAMVEAGQEADMYMANLRGRYIDRKVMLTVEEVDGHGLNATVKKVEKPVSLHEHQYRAIFEANNQAGSREFEFGWLSANEQAVRIAEEFGLDVERPSVQAFICTLVLKVLMSQK